MMLIGLLIATWPFDKVLTLLLFLFERFILELGSNTKKKRRGEMLIMRTTVAATTTIRTTIIIIITTRIILLIMMETHPLLPLLVI